MITLEVFVQSKVMILISESLLLVYFEYRLYCLQGPPGLLLLLLLLLLLFAVLLGFAKANHKR